MKILVTGAAGQLGTALQQLASGLAHHQFFFHDRSTLDITDAAAVREALQQTGAEVLVNCAAYTAVDKAESDMPAAMAINAHAPGVLAVACKNAGARLVHVSTDYVFNGQGSKPYREHDPVDPVNAYGATKLKGEEAVLASGADAIVIRTSWVYAPFGNNFVRTMLRLMQSRPQVGVVADQYGSPTNALDLAQAIVSILESGRWHNGVYHFSNEGVISWYDFAVAIRELSGFDCTVNALTTAEYPTPARRPAYSVMDKSRIVDTFGVQLRPWKESLARCLDQLKAEA